MDLRTTRFLKNITQPQLQKAARVHQSRISQAENGLIRLNDDERRRIERALGVPINWEQPKKFTRRI